MLTNSTPYTFVREGYFYYSRRVPSDLTDHYSYPRIVKALRTQSPQKARMLSVTASSQLETYWTQLRLIRDNVFGSNLVKEPRTPVNTLGSSIPAKVELQSDGPTLLDALDVYLTQRGRGCPKSFEVTARRACGYVIEVSTNKALANYDRSFSCYDQYWSLAIGTGWAYFKLYPF